MVSNWRAQNVAILLDNGDRTFQEPQIVAVERGPRGLSIADINGDGRLDIVVANEASQTVSVLLNITP